LIEINNVSKCFEEIEAVKNVSLQIKKGSIYGLLGSNGAGKTTLLRILAGIILQDKGSVNIQGEDVYENSILKDKCIFLPDTPFAFSHYNIQQMADFYSSIYSGWNEKRFCELRSVFQIDLHKKIHKLSKGMKRQVSFWFALSAMPEVLILDEPLDGLDPVMRKKVKQLMIEDVAEREMTILISSHNLREVEDLCDTIGILHKGEIVLQRDLDDLKSDIHKVQLAFKDAIPHGLYRNQQLLHKERRGSVIVCILKGNENEIREHFKEFQPVILDILPLTLEEIFIYEMGDVGYAIKSITV
jgi:ABC-2 type transport system ATP-binding protein